MKKTRFLLLFLVFSGAIFTLEAQNRRIFFEGTSGRPDHIAFFRENFQLEATASGYTVVANRDDAGYTFSFRIAPNTIVYEDGVEEPAPPDEPQFNIIITFIKNEDNVELATFDFPFSTLEEMFAYTQYLFLRAAVLIPPLDESDFTAQEDNEWQNKWLYLRVSAGFPFTFYQLMGNGLVGGKGVYAGTSKENPGSTMPLDNKVVALPGFTLGAEVQFLSFMSAEVVLQADLENLNNTNFVNMAAGVELKFPLKMLKMARNINLAPYGKFLFPMNLSSPSIFDSTKIFDSQPKFALGGGLQFGIRGGKSGSVFFDINYMNYLGDAVMINPYDPEYPNPATIHYKRQVFGFGAGYKFGFIQRK